MNSPLKSIDIGQRSPAPSYQGDFGSPSYSSYDPQFSTLNLEIVDSDLTAHDEILDEVSRIAKSSTKAHLIAVKRRLIEEKQAALLKAESEYLQQYGILQDEINGLKRDLNQIDASKEADAVKYEGTINRLTVSLFQKHRKSISTFSVQKLFNTWKVFAVSSMYLRKLDKSVAHFSRKTLLNKTLSTLRINCQHRKASNFEAESKFKFDQVTSEMISKYEAEIVKLREDLVEAYNVAQQETNKRQQMEEDLRRMFLKNMTNLNMEALSLFQTAYNAPSELDQDDSPALHRQISGSKNGKSQSKHSQQHQQQTNGTAPRQHHTGASAKQAQDYVSSLQQSHVHSDVITSSNLVGAPSYHTNQGELEKIRKLKMLQLQQQYNQAGLSKYGPGKSHQQNSSSTNSLSDANASTDGNNGEDEEEAPRPALLSSNGHQHTPSQQQQQQQRPVVNAHTTSLSAAYSGQLASTTKLANNVRNPPPTAVSRNVSVITTPLSSKSSPGGSSGGGYSSHSHHSPPYGRK